MGAARPPRAVGERVRFAPPASSPVDARGADRQLAITERADEVARIIQRRGLRLRRDNPRTMPEKRWRQPLSVWAERRTEVDEYRVVGKERVLAFVHVT